MHSQIKIEKESHLNGIMHTKGRMFGVFVTIFVTMMTLPPSECQSSHTARIDKLGESAMMTCTERNDVTFDYWLLPDVQTHVDDSYTGSQLQLLANHSLYIDSVEREHLGDYLCRVLSGTQPHYYRTTLYLYVPSLWEVYRQNVIVGCSAAGAALIFFIVICGIDHCRYTNRQERQRAKKPDSEVEMAYTSTSQGMVNNGYEVPGKYLAPDGSLVINTEQY